MHAVAVLLSPSMVPLRQACVAQLPKRPRTLRSVPGEQKVHWVLLLLSPSMLPAKH